MARQPNRRLFIAEDGGFSTVGMVLALTLSLSMVFGSVQVYRIYTTASTTQNVADAAALAAENQVASFYTVAHVCDAAVLSLSLTGVVLTGGGVVALCVPGCAPVGEKLLEAGTRMLDTRSRFAAQAAQGLNRLQSLLPFLAAAQAFGVAQANGRESGSTYLAVALLVPADGAPVDADSLDAAGQAASAAREGMADIEQGAREAEEAAREADACRQRAFEADCGNAPAYCMYERAGTLAGLAGAENPLYADAATWSFDVALRRAQAYYPARLAREHPATDASIEQARSAIRKRFYAYACDELANGYVHDDPDGAFEAYFPTLPRNTEQMRTTRLYVEQCYPITDDGQGGRLMHAWDGCPAAQGQDYAGLGSVQQWEEEALPECPECGFSAASVGKVAQASTSIDNGFEYHYAIVAQEAARYQQARNALDQAAGQARGPVRSIMDALSDLARQAAASRLSPQPPGRAGAVAVVADAAGVDVADLAPNPFARQSHALGVKLAVAGATLATEASDDEHNAIASLLDGLAQWIPGVGDSVLAGALGVWGRVLMAYADGQAALVSGVREVLDSLPLASRSGLGSWAAGKLQAAIDACGLQPASVESLKPVVVNSYHVVCAAEGGPAVGLRTAQEEYAQAQGDGTGPMVALLAGIAQSHAIEAIDDASFVVATLELAGEGGPEIPLEVALPQPAREGLKAIAERAADAVSGAAQEAMGVRQWE